MEETGRPANQGPKRPPRMFAVLACAAFVGGSGLALSRADMFPEPTSRAAAVVFETAPAPEPAAPASPEPVAPPPAGTDLAVYGPAVEEFGAYRVIGYYPRTPMTVRERTVVRAGPAERGAEARALEALEPGDRVQVTGRVDSGAAAPRWLRVRLANRRGVGFVQADVVIDQQAYRRHRAARLAAEAAAAAAAGAQAEAAPAPPPEPPPPPDPF